MSLTHKLIAKKSEYYPILGVANSNQKYLEMDFTENNQELFNFDLTDTVVFTNYVFNKIEKNNAQIGIGGYAENRAIYARSKHFNFDEEPRTIHLGLDIWSKAETPIYCPFDGQIHSFKNNNNFGDYGPTIIIKHQIENQLFYSLFGHLSLESIDNQYIGKHIKKGDLFCKIGNYPENGDWPPHLHFQIIDNIGDYFGDYPGVCKISEKEFYLKNCPDPNIMFSR